jgi:hypothetical protein
MLTAALRPESKEGATAAAYPLSPATAYSLSGWLDGLELELTPPAVAGFEAELLDVLLLHAAANSAAHAKSAPQRARRQALVDCLFTVSDAM